MPMIADSYYFAYQKEQDHLLPVVYIHGAGGSHLHWPAPMRRLGDYRVFALDLPAHGRSPGPSLRSIDSFARYIIRWMDTVGLEKAVFIGHSMGGAIALTLGLHHADRVLGLGLIGTGARLKVSPEIIELASNEKTFPTAVKMIISWAFSSSADARLVELASQRMLEIAPAVLHSDFIACNEFDVISVLSGINLPTLVLCGSDDRLTPWRYSQYLSEHIHSADLITIPDAGHMVMLESQSAVTKALNEFMAEIPY